MHRPILVIAGAALAVTVAVVGLVVYRHVAAAGRAAGPQVSVAPSEVEEPATVQSEEAPRKSRARPAAVKPAAEAAAPTEAAVPETPVEAAPVAETRDELKKRIGDLLAAASQEEKDELLQQLTQERRERFMEESRYRLPAEALVGSLKFQREGGLRLTELQSQQVDAAAQSLRPRMKASLEALWAREGELRQAIGQLYREGRRDEVSPLTEELRNVSREIEGIKAQFNDELRLQLQDVLNPEQQQEWLKARDGAGQRPQWIEQKR